MSPLYKYIPAKYLDAFVRRGEVLFRALSYFRDYEDEHVRGDEFEGTKLHRPANGLEITFTKTQEKILLPHSFEPAANEDDIFVYCLSTILSRELAVEFKADACIEIHRPAKFISEVRAALSRRPSIKSKMLVHGEVTYYNKEDPIGADWAIPERIAMSKLRSYEYQHEYRIAFAVNDAFRVANTRLRLVAPGAPRPLGSRSHPECLFKLGNLAAACTVHRFDQDGV
jgi:hypothetical protein